jgi:hypothetical protein
MAKTGVRVFVPNDYTGVDRELMDRAVVVRFD